MGHLYIKRIYEEQGADDGYRILIDRLWPRGVKKEAANIDEWAKEVTPSTELRKWFAHKEERFDTFREEYEDELNNNPDAHTFAKHCQELQQKDNVTLLYGAKSHTYNHAVILREWILDQQREIAHPAPPSFDGAPSQ
ncbi:MAG: DUF488 domain-containing protein [Porphyromonas sp.]|nr:DUF488 domain-containing protein [Porphyromonas sp.]